MCLCLQNWVSRVRKTGCAVPGSISGFSCGARGWCSSHVSDTAKKILANTVLGKKQTCSNLIWSPVSPRANLLFKLSGWGLGDPAAGKVGSWELYIPGVAGCYHWWIFLHKRKILTLETFRSGVPVMPERSARLVNTSTIPIFLRVLLIS